MYLYNKEIKKNQDTTMSCAVVRGSFWKEGSEAQITNVTADRVPYPSSGKANKSGQPGALYGQLDTCAFQRLKARNIPNSGKKNYFNHKKGFSGINKELP